MAADDVSAAFARLVSRELCDGELLDDDPDRQRLMNMSYDDWLEVERTDVWKESTFYGITHPPSACVPIRELLEAARIRRVTSVGCGFGLHEHLLAVDGFEVDGIERLRLFPRDRERWARVQFSFIPRALVVNETPAIDSECMLLLAPFLDVFDDYLANFTGSYILFGGFLHTKPSLAQLEQLPEWHAVDSRIDSAKGFDFHLFKRTAPTS